jgi:integrase
MAILAECPFCHRRQAVKNRNCAHCGQDLTKKKRAQKVRYWIVYRVNGKQRWEFVGDSLEKARAEEGDRKVKKFVNPGALEKVPAEKMTFTELAEWYLEQKTVKKLSSFTRIKTILHNFNEVFGNRIVSSIRLQDLEEYQEKREEEGRAAATIDMEISIVKTMVTKAFDNDLVDGRTVKAFRRVKRKLRRGANARRRTLTVAEYLNLVDVAAPHLKGIVITAYNTGMRLGEILGLRWAYVDREKWLIKLPADLTKESRAKVIPINHQVRKVLADNPRQTIHHDRVFTYRLEPIGTLGGIKKAFATACEKAGIIQGRNEADGLIFHDIRRTVKTNMLNAGVDKVHRDLILGHSLQGMDIHYMAPSEEDLRQAMDRYTAWLADKMEDVSKNVSKAPNFLPHPPAKSLK